VLLSFLPHRGSSGSELTLATTLALICAFCGFQAEHPLVMQLKQRRSLKPASWG